MAIFTPVPRRGVLRSTRALLLREQLAPGYVLVCNYRYGQILLGEGYDPSYKPAPLGWRVARILHGEVLLSAKQNRTKALSEGSGILGVLARGPLTNTQVVNPFGDLARLGPIVPGEPPPRCVDEHYGARPMYYGHVLGQLVKRRHLRASYSRQSSGEELLVVFLGGF